MSNYNTQLQSNNTDLQTVLQTLQTKAAGGEQATPVISVSSNGLITATAGTKSATKQLAFQAAKTITPSTASQIAVSSGYYTGGNVMVAGDSNLVASNIKSGVSIFGVNGTLVEGGGSSGDGYDEADSLIIRTMSSYTNTRVSTIGFAAFAYAINLKSVNFTNVKIIGKSAFQDCSNLITASFPACTSIGSSAFYNCENLTTISFPACTTIGGSAFYFCSKLITISFPACTSIGSSAFYNCWNLTTISFPACTTIGGSAFQHCDELTSVSFPVCTTIGGNAFQYCYRLSQVYLTNSKVCTLSKSNAFSSTPYAGYSAAFSGTPYIYVPQSLLTSYKTATNWTYFSSYFSAVESLGGGNGGSNNLITFTIDGTEYQAEEGMTWAEWCESEHNVDNYCSDDYDDLVYIENKDLYAVVGENGYVRRTDAIIDGYSYTLVVT